MQKSVWGEVCICDFTLVILVTLVTGIYMYGDHFFCFLAWFGKEYLRLALHML